MTQEDHIYLQVFIVTYLHQLSPTINNGLYYMQYILWYYIQNGYTGTPTELLRQAAKRYGRHPNTIASCIQRFARGAYQQDDDAEVIIARWQEIGWDETKTLTTSNIISLVCQGFFSYMERHYPERHQELSKIAPPR